MRDPKLTTEIIEQAGKLLEQGVFFLVGGAMYRRRKEKLKETVIELRANGLTYREIAEKIGVDERSIYRWLAADSEFKAQVEEAESLRFERLKDTAVDVLEQALTQRQIVEYEIHKNAEGQIRKVIEYVRVIPPDTTTALKIVEKLDKHFTPSDGVATIQVNLFPTAIPKEKDSEGEQR